MNGPKNPEFMRPITMEMTPGLREEIVNTLREGGMIVQSLEVSDDPRYGKQQIKAEVTVLCGGSGNKVGITGNLFLTNFQVYDAGEDVPVLCSLAENIEGAKP